MIKVSGKVVKRTDDTINSNLPTGDIEVYVKEIEILSKSEEVPLPVFGDACAVYISAFAPIALSLSQKCVTACYLSMIMRM